MAERVKQDVNIETTAAPAPQKSAADLWLRPYEELKHFFERAPADQWMRPYQDFERMFERMLGKDWRTPAHWSMPVWGDLFGSGGHRVPSMDVVDQDDHILVRVELPGVRKDDVKVSLSDNVLTVKAETCKEEKKAEGDYYRREIAQSACSRSVTLPVNVDAAKVTATLADGVLEITLGKTDEAKKRNIKVQ
jgi:HSP20 family protein